MKRRILLLIVFSCLMLTARAQWVMEFYITGGPSPCSWYFSNPSFSGTFTSSSGATTSGSSGGDYSAKFTVTSIDGNFSGTLSGSGSGTCACIDPGGNTPPGCTPSSGSASTSLAISHNAALGDRCVIYSKQASGSNFYVSISARVWKIMDTPSVPGTSSFTCASTSATITSPTVLASGWYTWEVSENGGPFQYLTSSTSNVITPTIDDLKLPSFSSKYSNRSIRVTDGSCPDRKSQPSLSFNFPKPSPTFTAPPTAATCNYVGGASTAGRDASITITITNTANVADNMLATINGPGGELKQFGITKAAGSRTIYGSDFTSGIYEGNWTVAVMNNGDGNCSNTALTVAVPVTPALTYTELSKTPVSCFSQSDGTFQIQVQHGSPTYTVVPAPTSGASTNTISFTGKSAGDYTMTITDSKGCVGTGPAVSVTQPNPLVINPIDPPKSNGFPIACNGGSISVTASATGGNLPYGFLWQHGPSGATVSGLVAGPSYQVSVSDAKGCSSTPVSFSLTQPSAVTASFTHAFKSNNLDLLCPDNHDGNVTIVPGGGVGSYTYKWFDNNASVNRMDLSIGSNAVTIKDANQCPLNTSVTITGPPAMILKTTATSDHLGRPISCVGEDDGSVKVEVEMYGKSPFSYHWNTGQNTAEIDFLVAGTYTAEVTDSYNCKVSKPITISNPAPITPVPLVTVNPSYHGAHLRCFGESNAALDVNVSNAAGNVYYDWNTKTPHETTKIVTGVGAGTYTITVTDDNDCEGSETITVIPPPQLAANIQPLSDFSGQIISCTGKNDGEIQVTASGGITSSPYSYEWVTTGEITDVRTDLFAGDYKVDVTDINGCKVRAAITIPDPVSVQIDIASISSFTGFGVSCPGLSDGRITVAGAGGAAGYSYQWIGGPATDSWSGLIAGDYQIDMKDQNGCEASRVITITEADPLVLTPQTITPVSCFGGSNGVVLLAMQGGAAPFKYSDNHTDWKDENEFTAYIQGDYSFYVKDNNGCETTTSATVNQPPIIAISFDDVRAAYCADPRGQANSVVVGGVGSYQYDWKNSAGVTVSSTSKLREVKAGAYVLTITDANSCVMQNTVPITSTDGAQTRVEYTVDPLCFESGDGKAKIEVISGSGSYQYRWPDGQTTLEVTNLHRGTHIVEITDIFDCTVTQPVVIDSPAQLKVSEVKNVPANCFGECNGSIEVIASGGTADYTYKWNDNSTQTTLKELCKGEYSIEVTDAHLCMTTGKFTIEEPLLLTASLTSEQIPTCLNGCDGALTVIAAGGNGTYAYNWDNGSLTSNNSAICPGDYRVTVTDAKGCSVVNTLTLHNQAPVVVNLGEDVTLCVGQTYVLDAGRFTSYNWTSNAGFTATTQKVIIKDPALYKVEVTTPAGCKGEDSFILQTSTDLLKAEFIMVDKAMVNDTIVFLDITWPGPDSLNWKIPKGLHTILKTNAGDLFGQFKEAGVYTVGMEARLGECLDYMEKTITILSESEEEDSGGRLGYEEKELISFTLAPNPNDGMFQAAVSLRTKQSVTLSVIEATTGKMIRHADASNQNEYLLDFDLRPLSAGVYVLRLDYESGTNYIRFLVK